MKSIKPFFCLSLFFFVFGFVIHAQQHKPANPLLTFFQVNFDSTIIYHSWSSWHPQPDYLIMAKKHSTMYFFTYRSPYSWTSGRSFPGQLSEKFNKEQLLFEQTPPDTNRYFLPFFINPDDRKYFWFAANSFNIWQTQDAPTVNTNCNVADGSTDTFFLITRGFMKEVTYYEADSLENCQTPDIHRKNAIATKKAIKDIFK